MVCDYIIQKPGDTHSLCDFFNWVITYMAPLDLNALNISITTMELLSIINIVYCQC